MASFNESRASMIGKMRQPVRDRDTERDEAKEMKSVRLHTKWLPPASLRDCSTS